MNHRISPVIALAVSLLLPQFVYAQDNNAPNDAVSADSLKAAFESQEWEKAFGIAEKLLETDSENIDFLAIAGISNAQLNHNDIAEKYFLKIQTLHPDDPRNIGNLCYAQNALARNDALQTCKKAAKLNPDKAAFSFIAGQLFENANNLEEAREAYETAYKLAPDDVQYLTALTNINYLQKDYRKMAENTEAAINRGLEMPVLYLNLLSAFNLSGEYEKTLTWAEKGYEKYKDPGILLSKGEALYHLDRIDEAAKVLREAKITISETSVLWPRAAYYLARVMLVEPCTSSQDGTCVQDENACCSKIREAVALLNAIATRSALLPDKNYDVYLGLAQILDGNLEGAEATLSKAIHGNMNQDNASALAALAVALYRFDKPRDRKAAIQYYRQALDASPDFADFEKIRKTRHWPKSAIDTLAQIKAEIEKPKSVKSGCGCDISNSHSQNNAPITGLLGLLLASGIFFRMRRKSI